MKRFKDKYYEYRLQDISSGDNRARRNLGWELHGESGRTFEITFLNGSDPILLHLQLFQHIQSAERLRRHFGQLVSSQIQSPQLSAIIYSFFFRFICSRLTFNERLIDRQLFNQLISLSSDSKFSTSCRQIFMHAWI